MEAASTEICICLFLFIYSFLLVRSAVKASFTEQKQASSRGNRHLTPGEGKGVRGWVEGGWGGGWAQGVLDALFSFPFMSTEQRALK